MKSTIFWFRTDLRLQDHPGLIEASKRGPIYPVYIYAPEEEAPWQIGSSSQGYLKKSLETLDLSLRKRGSALIIRKGTSLSELLNLAEETGATEVFFSRRYEPASLEREQIVIDGLASMSIKTKSFNSSLLIEPWAMKPYRVFTPFWKTVEKLSPFVTYQGNLHFADAKKVKSLKIDDLALPTLIGKWESGEESALKKWQSFQADGIKDYEYTRDFLDQMGTSGLSAHLHFGEISPRTIWESAGDRSGPFLRQLVWREFAYHLLYYHPKTPQEPFREDFQDFPWNYDEPLFEAWKSGQTGVPIVDAAMRQLLVTGWMPNRARMIVASYLTKDLLLPWQWGAKWFWETLVDADLANNTLGWQWVAGSGADAAPYFRVFNPALQAKKFDPEGIYIKTWVPELAKLPASALHEPSELESISCGYPLPLINHAAARERALNAYQRMKNEDHHRRG